MNSLHGVLFDTIPNVNVSANSRFMAFMQHLQRTEWVNNAVFNVRRKSLTLRVWSRRSSDSAFQVIGPQQKRPGDWHGSATHSSDVVNVDDVGGVGDRNAAVDQVFQCSVLQTLEHRDCELVLHSLWNVEPVQLVMQQLWQSTVVLVGTSDEAGRATSSYPQHLGKISMQSIGRVVAFPYLLTCCKMFFLVVLGKS